MKKRQIGVFLGLLLFTVVVSTAEAQLKPPATRVVQVMQLCDAVNCLALPPPPPKPQILHASASVHPGNLVYVNGSGFGNARGEIWLSGVNFAVQLQIVIPDPAYPQYPQLACDSLGECATWHDDYIKAMVPADISGQPDSTMSISVKTREGGESNLWSVSFVAAREFAKLPPNMVRVVSCASSSSANFCHIPPPYIFWSDPTTESFHLEDWLGHQGTDVYSTVALRNGWVFFSGRFVVAPGGVFAGTFATVKPLHVASFVPVEAEPGTVATFWYFPFNTVVSTTVTVDWGTSFIGRLFYKVDFYVFGPRGVPYQ